MPISIILTCDHTSWSVRVVCFGGLTYRTAGFPTKQAAIRFAMVDSAI